LNVSYDQGATWEFVNTIPAAQFYAIGVDMRKPYYVYGGLQDNGSWGGPSQTRSQQNGITNADWYRVGGGDGFYLRSIRLITTSSTRSRRAARCSVWICAPAAA
jgi:beta-glucanase (GH16 family)